jgi:hypothetical protein
MNRTRWLRWALGLLATGLCLWGVIPAWHLWQSHETQLQTLAQQRQAMQATRQEVLALQGKAPMAAATAQSRIAAIAQQHLGTQAKLNPGSGPGLNLTLKDADPGALTRAWTEIRQQTSASVIRTDLTLGPQGWTGTLVLQLAKQP